MFDLCFCEIILQKIQMTFSGSANALLGRCPQLFVMYVCDVQLCYDSVWHLFRMLDDPFVYASMMRATHHRHAFKYGASAKDRDV